QFQSAVKKNGLSMMGQTKELAPADARMYALRDVTATVDCIPLIVASIMSKKLAAGTDGMVLDVKYGKGAFMRTFPSAKLLAKWLVKTGELFGKKMVALVTDMNQPLGNKLGNSLEIEEAVEVLRGEGPEDLKELSLALSAQMLCLGGIAKNFEEGIRLSKTVIQNGTALKKFEKMIGEQGGDVRALHTFKYLPKAQRRVEFFSRQKGIIHEIDARLLGNVVSMLGGGRQKIDEKIDHSVGVVLHKKVGDAVSPRESLLTLHYNDEKKREAVEGELAKAFVIKKEKVRARPLIRSVVDVVKEVV
ncbi:MAG: thymidine phosphorylase, partial [Deltaproteobacteria bacterium]